MPFDSGPYLVGAYLEERKNGDEWSGVKAKATEKGNLYRSRLHDGTVVNVQRIDHNSATTVLFVPFEVISLDAGKHTVRFVIRTYRIDDNGGDPLLMDQGLTDLFDVTIPKTKTYLERFVGKGDHWRDTEIREPK